jgi:hypothetical protein
VIWQDLVIALCQVGAIVALQFIIWSKEKPSLTSSVMNTIFPLIISFCMFTLELYFAMTTAAIVGISWGVITLQILVTKKQKQPVQT